MKEDLSLHDIDPRETGEWKESLDAVLEKDGPDRVRFLLKTLLDRSHRSGVEIPSWCGTSYINTIPPHQEHERPGDPVLERKIKSLIRWNATAMVVRANRRNPGLGGHIATYASAATLYEIGFNHFFRAPQNGCCGDIVFYQGHASPGIYAHAYLEGRLAEKDLERFRREAADGKPGLSSYPHPRLMPDFWTVPTVSMGLGAIMGIYQARFMKYLDQRGLIDAGDRKVWVFLGDGEMDEPEAQGAISLAGRENLDNLIFVVNCNLQRLDGPVRGDGKIIQELETVFRGSGWNVIKVIWGREWDPLLAQDEQGLLEQRMMEVVDGEYQAYAVKGGAYVREHFFGKYPELEKMVAELSDDEIWKLKRGGHDPQKVYAAYAAAVRTKNQPTVILAKTIKGYGLGAAGEGLNIAHQAKKLDREQLLVFRDRFDLDLNDEEAQNAEYHRPAADSPEIRYLKERREALGGWLPARHVSAEPLEIPALEVFKRLLEGSGEREFSTTLAFVRVLMSLLREPRIRDRIVPIVADEARTFGMDGLFRQIAIYAPKGQLFEPVDVGQIAYYREAKDGQFLQEGITEAGALSSWGSAGTAHLHHGQYMIPFFVFYSMFGFQRVGDLIWAAADMRARGFLIGGTSGRTTLSGEGLQHCDGHSQLLASTVPACVSYDPAFAYELAVIVQHGLHRMYVAQEDVFFYVTTGNESYRHPPLPSGVEADIRRGMYLLRPSERIAKEGPRVQLMGSGAILREVLAAAERLEEDFAVAADVWSVTSFTELRRQGLQTERWNLLHPAKKARTSFVANALAGHRGPVVAASDYVKAYADQIRPFIKRPCLTLGTDGFGRSDTRAALRRYFEVDRDHVTLAALKALAETKEISDEKVSEAIERYDIDPEKTDPAAV
jgi:pyruvate dehydrogenase E1 component